MSSFFTVPASQRKRKREDRAAAPATKKRGVDAKNDTTGGRRARERDDSISGSDLDDDEDALESLGSGSDSESDSDDGETAADRRLKLAERYLDNIREDVEDTIGFDAAEIDRDLIAERLKEDVVCEHCPGSCQALITNNNRSLG
jgi:ribosomal RNA-processing protein 9